jgi:hypothetical protein
VYLVEVEDLDELERWLVRNLQGAVRDRAQWVVHGSATVAGGSVARQAPEWCFLELHTVVVDTDARRSQKMSSKREERCSVRIEVPAPYILN